MVARRTADLPWVWKAGGGSGRRVGGGGWASRRPFWRQARFWLFLRGVASWLTWKGAEARERPNLLRINHGGTMAATEAPGPTPPKRHKLVGYQNFKRSDAKTDRFRVQRFHHVEFWCEPLSPLGLFGPGVLSPSSRFLDGDVSLSRPHPPCAPNSRSRSED